MIPEPCQIVIVRLVGRSCPGRANPGEKLLARRLNRNVREGQGTGFRIRLDHSIEDSRLRFPCVERFARRGTAWFLHALSVFAPLQIVGPLVPRTASPAIITASGRGLPFTLSTGTNCHRPPTARYFFRFTLTAMLTIHLLPALVSKSIRCAAENSGQLHAQDSNLNSKMDSK